MPNIKYEDQTRSSYTYENSGQELTLCVGDYELLEANDPRHVLFQGRELQGRQEAAIQLHDRFSRGETQVPTIYSLSVY